MTPLSPLELLAQCDSGVKCPRGYVQYLFRLSPPPKSQILVTRVGHRLLGEICDAYLQLACEQLRSVRLKAEHQAKTRALNAVHEIGLSDSWKGAIYG